MTRRAWAALAALLGAALLGSGLWIPAKAALAQVLLGRAWERARAGDPDARPWPWADFAPVARIRVPRLGASVIVLRGADGGTLAFGPGHLAGSARPGERGNAVVAGHRDTHFAFLGAVEVGDGVVVEMADGALRRYVVTAREVRHERDARPLAETDVPALTLVTCWPFEARAPGGRSAGWCGPRRPLPPRRERLRLTDAGSGARSSPPAPRSRAPPRA